MNVTGIDVATFGLGLLIIRFVIGSVMAAHGAQKLLGWFGGHGLGKTGEFFAGMGFQPGRAFAAAASLAEITSGVLVTIGFLGPIGPALMISVMIVAIATVHWHNGLFAMTNGIEVPLLYGTAAAGLALVGYGPYALDAWLGVAERWTPMITWIVLVAGALGGLANLAIRQSTHVTQTAHADRNR
jgi:putative oxidoreductase